MKQADESALLIAELKRVIDLLSDHDSEMWVNHSVAELKAKFREIRRDTMRYEKQFFMLHY